MNNHGGKRAGSGRKKKDVSGTQSTITLKVSEDTKEKYTSLVKIENALGNKTDRTQFFYDLINKEYENKLDEYNQRKDHFYTVLNSIIISFADFFLSELKRRIPKYKEVFHYFNDDYEDKPKVRKFANEISSFQYYLENYPEKENIKNEIENLYDYEKKELNRIIKEIERKQLSLFSSYVESLKDWTADFNTFIDEIRHSKIYDI